MADGSINMGYRLKHQRTVIPTKKLRQLHSILREEIEIEHHLDYTSREDGLSHSRARKSCIHGLKDWRRSHTKETTHSSRPWKSLTTSLLTAALLALDWSLLIGPAQSVLHTSLLALFYRLTLLPHYRV